MNEQEKIDQFNQDLDNLLKGNPTVQGSTDAERVEAARRLAKTDFSARSRTRATTRARLLARAHREIPVLNKRKEMNTKFSSLFRTLAFGAFLLMIVFGLGWVLSNTSPQVGVGLEGTSTPDSVFGSSENPPTRIPEGFPNISGLIVFESRKDGNGEIYVGEANGYSPKNLTNNPAEDWYPLWSPDGNRIAFISERTGSAQIFVMNLDGSNMMQLTNDAQITDVSVCGEQKTSSEIDFLGFQALNWSPDGTYIVVSLGMSIDGNMVQPLFLIKTDGSGMAQLTSDGNDINPQWSPDGQRIAFSRLIDCTGEVWHDIFTIHPDGNGLSNLTNNPASEITFAWAPHGSQIVYFSTGVEMDTTRHDEVRLMDAGGSNQRLLVDLGSGHEFENGDFAWLMDGERIAFIPPHNGDNIEVFSVKMDGTELTPLAATLEKYTSLDLSPDGQWLIISAGVDLPAFYFVSLFSPPQAFGNELSVFKVPNGGTNPQWQPGIPQMPSTVFRSETNHLEVTVPEGWAAYEGEAYIARPFTGLVAFNSWGEQRFWALQVITEQNDGSTTYSYSSEDVLAQIPQDGAYVVLVWESSQPVPDPNSPDGPYLWGPITDPEAHASYYPGHDLLGIWQPADCRLTRGVSLDFSKFERVLHLEIYCGPQASESTVEAVNSLLSSWRFDATQPVENPTPIPTLEPLAPLALDSDSETIRQRILFSYMFWQSMWVDAQIDDYNGVTSSQRVQVWLNQPAQARVLSGPLDGVPGTLWISDGQLTRTGEDLTGYGLDGSYLPPATESNTVYPHPMTGIMPTVLSDLLFPSGLAQRGGTYRPIAIETLAGRETLVVEWNRPDGPLVDRFWVDTQTGVILRQQNYGKGADGALTAEYLITNLQYDLNFQPETFNRLAAFPPAFATAPEDIHTEVATPVPAGEPDTSLANGEIYLFLQKPYGQEPMGLWRFPAGCLVSGDSCPSLERVPGLPQDFVPPVFSWSPDGNQMLYHLADTEGQHFLFDRAAQSWTDLQAPWFWGEVWSPDGSWVAGAPPVFGDQNSNPLIVGPVDGSEWQEILPNEPGFKMGIGWLDEHRILFQNTLDNEISPESPTEYQEFQIYDLQTGEIQVLHGIKTDPEKSFVSVPFLSPDRTKLVYTIADLATQTSEIKIIHLADASEFPIGFPLPVSPAWSPDGQWLTLTAMLGFTCEIHLMRPDGSDPHHVFTGDWGGSCQPVWSPDGQYILVSALAQTPTIPRLYVINVATGESRLVELPDVGVEFEWPVVSWVP